MHAKNGVAAVCSAPSAHAASTSAPCHLCGPGAPAGAAAGCAGARCRRCRRPRALHHAPAAVHAAAGGRGAGAAHGAGRLCGHLWRLLRGHAKVCRGARAQHHPARARHRGHLPCPVDRVRCGALARCAPPSQSPTPSRAFTTPPSCAAGPRRAACSASCARARALASRGRRAAAGSAAALVSRRGSREVGGRARGKRRLWNTTK